MSDSQPAVPTEAAMLKDLELQWQDHQHMRDQTWKVLASNLIFLVGVVSLASQKPPAAVLATAHVLLIAAALLGWAVSTHHRLRQAQKFDMIVIYEKHLGLYPMIEHVLTAPEYQKGLAGRLFTQNFIGILQLGIAALGCVLYYYQLFPGA